MALSAEVRKLLQQALKIRDSEVPFHRVLDLLAADDGDVSKVVNRFRDIKEPSLRRAFHQCALLLRELESEAGLAPAWEPSAASRAASSAGAGAGAGAGASRSAGSGGGSGSGSGGGSGAGGATAPSAKAVTAAVRGVKFRPEELQTFEDDAMRGQARMGKVYVDGASKGNPGPSGIGVALFAMGGQKIGQISKHIGSGTNNQAEYTALIEALALAQRMKVETLFIFSDSELMVKQVKGEYKVKNPDIQERMEEVRALLKGFEKYSITWIPREKNTLADALSTNCLPKSGKGGAGGKKAGGVGGEASEDLMGAIDETADEGATE